MHQFDLSEKEEENYEEWLKTLPEIPNGHFGAIGGGYYFKFIPTGLGNIIVVGREDVLDMEKDITDYDVW